MGLGYTYARLADFSGGSNAGLFLYNANTGAATLGVGDASGNFTFNSISLSPGYTLADVGDLNGDGKSDVILYNPTSGDATTGISNGTGFTFTSLSFSPGFTSIRLADYTGGGKASLTIYSSSTAFAYFGTGNGDGTFAIQALFWDPGYDNVVAEDVNGDGLTDVILYNRGNGTQYAGLSSGSGKFTYVLDSWPTQDILASVGGSLLNHPAFLLGEISLGSGVYYLQFLDGNLFGYYNYPSSGVIYHYDMGFEGLIPGSAAMLTCTTSRPATGGTPATHCFLTYTISR